MDGGTAMSGGLGILRAAKEQLLADADARWPEEACGFLLGDGSRRSRLWTVVETRPTPNAAWTDRGHRFRIDAAELRSVARRTDRRVFGVYHSHVGRPAIPSSSDRENAGPGWLQLIVATARGGPPDLRLYRTPADPRTTPWSRLSLVTLRGDGTRPG